MERTRRRQGYTERLNTKTGKWERVRSTKPAPAPAKPPAKPAAAKPAVAKPSASKPNPYTSGKPNPNAAARGVIGSSAKKVTGLKGVTGQGLGALQLGMIGAELATQAGYARGGRNYREFTRAQDKPPAKPVKRDPNNRSSQGVNTPEGRTVPTGSQEYNDYRNQQLAAERERLKGVGNPPKQKPKPPAPKPQPSRPATSRPATPAAPKKPAAPASPKDRRVSAATANRESGNYGTSRTNNPMIDDAMKARMRQREERQAGASGSSKPEDKSKYVASDGRQYKGPAFGNDAKPNNTASSKPKSSDKGMTLAERMRKRRQGMA